MGYTQLRGLSLHTKVLLFGRAPPSVPLRRSFFQVRSQEVSTYSGLRRSTSGREATRLCSSARVTACNYLDPQKCAELRPNTPKKSLEGDYAEYFWSPPRRTF